MENTKKADGNLISPIFRWKKDVKKEDIQAHLKNLEAAINYYINRNKPTKVAELIREKESLEKFYNL